MVGALALLWLRVMTPREAYASIDWQVLLMLYGLLGLGMAMQNTGTAEWLAAVLVEIAETPRPAGTHAHRDVVADFPAHARAHRGAVQQRHGGDDDSDRRLAGRPSSGSNPRPFIIGVTVAASCAFALPMGYQTHMMIYGPGGYRFTDFLRVGIPLNLICWITSCLLIPLIWPFHP